MKDSNDKSDLFREMAIVDHVAGNQSEAARRSFEDAMEQDASLREAVVAEMFSSPATRQQSAILSAFNKMQKRP